VNLSSLIAPGAAILPFAAVLAVCGFLLALPSGESALVTNSSVASVPQTNELQPSLPAREPPHIIVTQDPPIELGASPPVATAPGAHAMSDAISDMSAWWAVKSRQHQAAPRKARLSTRKFRRHQAVFQRGQGCPPSICSGAVAILPDPRRWQHTGN
jgi:hypothetical protein